MSHWNYRLISHPDAWTESKRWLMIHEVYYDDKGNIMFWTEDGKSVGGEDIANVLEIMDMMRKDINHHPVLMIEDLNKLMEKRKKKGKKK